MSKDGTSRRVCRVVWRKDRHIGVQFLQSDENDDVYPAPPARWRRAAPAPALAFLSVLDSPPPRGGGEQLPPRPVAPSYPIGLPRPAIRSLCHCSQPVSDAPTSFPE